MPRTRRDAAQRPDKPSGGLPGTVVEGYPADPGDRPSNPSAGPGQPRLRRRPGRLPRPAADDGTADDGSNK